MEVRRGTGQASQQVSLKRPFGRLPPEQVQSAASVPPSSPYVFKPLPNGFFDDVQLDKTVFEKMPTTAGTLVKTRFNGIDCYFGKTRFVGPTSIWQLLNPFAKFFDPFGNRFFLPGVLGFLVALHSAKLRQPVDVVCIKNKNGFEVVRFGKLDAFESSAPLCAGCLEEHEFCTCELI
jgi:hypothetical protein